MKNNWLRKGMWSKPIIDERASALFIKRTLKSVFALALSGGSLVQAAETTMENNMSTVMESAVSRSQSSSYEAAVTWGRDANFNLQSTRQPAYSFNATAIGNLVNVAVSGAGNTVVVNAMQINNGSQNASIMFGRAGALETKNSTPSNNTTQVQTGSGGSNSNGK